MLNRQVFLQEIQILKESAGWGACNPPPRINSNICSPFFSSSATLPDLVRERRGGLDTFSLSQDKNTHNFFFRLAAKRKPRPSQATIPDSTVRMSKTAGLLRQAKAFILTCTPGRVQTAAEEVWKSDAATRRPQCCRYLSQQEIQIQETRSAIGEPWPLMLCLTE